MENVFFFIISKQLRIRMTLEFGIKVGEEVGMAEQYPIKEENIVNFHEVKHNEEPYKKFPEGKLVLEAIPGAENDSPEE